MNNTFKKPLAILLSVLTVLSCGINAFAQSEETVTEPLETNFTCDDYLFTETVVVTFDSKYSETGEIPDILVYSREYEDETVNLTQVSEDRISLKIYEHNGKKYPQLFIDTDFCWKVLALEIGEGAFVTESGEKSAKVEIPYSKIQQRHLDGFKVECEIRAYQIAENLLDPANMDIYYFATVGDPVKVNVSIQGNHADVWLEEAQVTYTVNGKTVEIESGEFIPEEPGEYVVRIQLNDMMTRKVKFNVVSEQTAYFDSLGMAGKRMLLSPLEFLFGLFSFITIPVIGTIGGAGIMLDSFRNVGGFFKAIVAGPTYYDHTVR